jgi:predicted DNA-binding transcriptional regulator AlpA
MDCSMHGHALKLATDIRTADAALGAEAAAIFVGLSMTGFWKAVRTGRLPDPVYPLPRAPRWYPSELRASLELTRQTPRTAVADRRAARTLRDAADDSRIVGPSEQCDG